MRRPHLGTAPTPAPARAQSVDRLVLLLAAGRGERMRPLTDHTPKPLLEAGGQPLICWHLMRLAEAGFRQVVINLAHLGEQIVQAVGSGERWGLRVFYSRESAALETAGAVVYARDLLGPKPFLMVSADVYTEFDFTDLASHTLAPGILARLVMVQNPAHHPAGDFCVDADGLLRKPTATAHALTYAGIGLFSIEMFEGIAAGSKLPLRPLLNAAVDARHIQGEIFCGRWHDVGTPERLALLRSALQPAG